MISVLVRSTSVSVFSGLFAYLIVPQIVRMTYSYLGKPAVLRYELFVNLDLVRIVQNPGQNGQRYYLDVMQNFEKALKLNPNNELAQQLQQKFYEGMRQATGSQMTQ